MTPKIIMLTGGSESSIYMYNALKKEFNISKIVLEGKEDKKKFLKRRIKRLGIMRVIGQVLFQLVIPPLQRKFSQNRIEEIKTKYGLDDEPFHNSEIKRFISVNSEECIDFLTAEEPDIVIVNGTRIISKKVLNSVNGNFINTHMGITPRYRGVHGGYWAIANNDKENCGVTVHLVDSGIDTGAILYQQIIGTTYDDNFSTYTYLQIGEGIKLMKKAISAATNKELKSHLVHSEFSKLWYHPTIWYYFYRWIFSGVK